MAASKKKLPGYVKRLVFLNLLIFLSSHILFSQSFKLYQASDLVKVFQDKYNMPPLQDTMKIFGIRGEVISAQCVIVAKNNLTHVTAEIGPLKHVTTDILFPKANIIWNFVGYVPLSKNSPNQPLHVLSRPAPALFPDYLTDIRQVSVKKGQCQPVWLTITIPENIDPGNYTGGLIVRSSHGEQSLPVHLTVYPLTLPEKQHLKIVEWYSTGDFEKYYGINTEYSDAWFSMLKTYADNMVAHKQNTFRVSMNTIKISRTSHGTFKFDFSLFDKTADVFWSTGKMDYLETGFLTEYGEGGWYTTEILLKDIEVTDPATGDTVTLAGKEVIPYLLPAFEDHLRRKGWLDKTMFHIKDEPSLHNALSYREISAYFHHLAPDLKRMDAIETTYVLEGLDIATPKLDYFGTWYPAFKKWQEEGHELWFYTVGIYQGSLYPNKTIDVPLMDSRIMHWLNYKYEATGYLHWGWNRWKGEDPYKDPGKHIGDGWLVYPTKNGVLNSLRWEEMRNGFQDYECFRMLEDKIKTLKDSLGSRFSWISPKQRSQEIASMVVTTMTEHVNNTRTFYDAKRKIIRELLDFDTSPRIYVQTNPPEYSTLTDHSSVEVFGWAEPGAKIIINNEEIPVSKEGLFLEQFSMSPGKNKITVLAADQYGTKRIIRSFNIEK